MATDLATMHEQQIDQRFVLYGVDWDVYEGILKALDDRPTRLTFDGKNLELMSPSPIHEMYSYFFGRLLEALTLELNIPIRGGRSTTFKRKDIDRGLEPDECYWIQNEAAVRGKRDIDLQFDPPPDLAIEIDITRSSLDRKGIYARLGVPEVWRFDGESIQIRILQSSGVYADSDTSGCLPLLPVQELIPFLQPDEQLDDTTRARKFTAWIRQRFNRDRQ